MYVQIHCNLYYYYVCYHNDGLFERKHHIFKNEGVMPRWLTDNILCWILSPCVNSESAWIFCVCDCVRLYVKLYGNLWVCEFVWCYVNVNVYYCRMFCFIDLLLSICLFLWISFNRWLTLLRESNFCCLSVSYVFFFFVSPYCFVWIVF